jgi:hypothetical protein
MFLSLTIFFSIFNILEILQQFRIARDARVARKKKQKEDEERVQQLSRECSKMDTSSSCSHTLGTSSALDTTCIKLDGHNKMDTIMEHEDQGSMHTDNDESFEVPFNQLGMCVLWVLERFFKALLRIMFLFLIMKSIHCFINAKLISYSNVCVFNYKL